MSASVASATWLMEIAPKGRAQGKEAAGRYPPAWSGTRDTAGVPPFQVQCSPKDDDAHEENVLWAYPHAEEEGERVFGNSGANHSAPNTVPPPLPLARQHSQSFNGASFAGPGEQWILSRMIGQCSPPSSPSLRGFSLPHRMGTKRDNRQVGGRPVSVPHSGLGPGVSGADGGDGLMGGMAPAGDWGRLPSDASVNRAEPTSSTRLQAKMGTPAAAPVRIAGGARPATAAVASVAIASGESKLNQMRPRPLALSRSPPVTQVRGPLASPTPGAPTPGAPTPGGGGWPMTAARKSSPVVQDSWKKPEADGRRSKTGGESTRPSLPPNLKANKAPTSRVSSPRKASPPTPNGANKSRASSTRASSTNTRASGPLPKAPSPRGPSVSREPKAQARGSRGTQGGSSSPGKAQDRKEEAAVGHVTKRVYCETARKRSEGERRERRGRLDPWGGSEVEDEDKKTGMVTVPLRERKEGKKLGRSPTPHPVRHSRGGKAEGALVSRHDFGERGLEDGIQQEEPDLPRANTWSDGMPHGVRAGTPRLAGNMPFVLKGPTAVKGFPRPLEPTSPAPESTLSSTTTDHEARTFPVAFGPRNPNQTPGQVSVHSPIAQNQIEPPSLSPTTVSGPFSPAPSQPGVTGSGKSMGNVKPLKSALKVSSGSRSGSIPMEKRVNFCEAVLVRRF